MKKFNIIIPVYNHKEFLKKCLNSIEIQEYPKELIFVYIIDDNPNDKYNVPKHNFEIFYKKNKERMHPAFNRYSIYTKINDNDLILFLDGDDWLVDSKVLNLLNNIYSNNDICWSISNHKLFKNGNIRVKPYFVNSKLIIDKPCICHLRCGYGYIWNKMKIDWIIMNKKYIKWMSDWNENLFALKYHGQPFKINSSLCVYNLDTVKTKNENTNYNEMIVYFKNKMKE